MAKVYAPPEGFDPPDSIEEAMVDGKFSYDKMCAVEDAYINRLAAEACRRSSHELVGKTVRFPCGDGYAVYIVWDVKPLTLVHVPVGDAWEIPAAHERGLTLADVRSQIEHAEKLDRLFGRS